MTARIHQKTMQSNTTKYHPEAIVRELCKRIRWPGCPNSRSGFPSAVSSQHQTCGTFVWLRRLNRANIQVEESRSKLP